MADYKAFTVHVPDNERSIIIDVKVCLPSSYGYSKKQMIPLKAKALIDTGATRSCIKHTFVETVNPPAYGRATTKTSQGEYISTVYKVDIIFPNNIIVRGIKVSEFFMQHDFDIIIGMDILKMGDMAISNADNKTVFSFRVPSNIKHIDFTKFNPE